MAIACGPLEPGDLGKLGVRGDAHTDDDQIGVDAGAVGKSYAGGLLAGAGSAPGTSRRRGDDPVASSMS